jgi:hypothetical protein
MIGEHSIPICSHASAIERPTPAPGCHCDADEIKARAPGAGEPDVGNHSPYLQLGHSEERVDQVRALASGVSRVGP